MAPEDRPSFKELYSSVSKSIEREAGYLQFGFNPFTGGGGGGREEVNGKGKGGDVGGSEGEDKEGEGEGATSGVAINVIPPSLDTNGAHTVFSNPSTN